MNSYQFSNRFIFSAKYDNNNPFLLHMKIPMNWNFSPKYKHQKADDKLSDLREIVVDLWAEN